MTSQIASEAEEIAEIERDWNAFDLRALLVKLSNEEDDMKDVTLRLKVSELRKDAEKSYTVTVDAKLRYGVFLRMTLMLNVFVVHEESGEKEAVQLLTYSRPSIPNQDRQTTIHSFTHEQLWLNRKEVGSLLAEQYMEFVLVLERSWDREWRALWDPRKDHVRRALFAFFKGESIDVRKRIYMMFRTCWLHDFTKPC